MYQYVLRVTFPCQIFNLIENHTTSAQHNILSVLQQIVFSSKIITLHVILYNAPQEKNHTRLLGLFFETINHTT